jgi:hypothetical protein
MSELQPAWLERLRRTALVQYEGRANAAEAVRREGVPVRDRAEIAEAVHHGNQTAAARRATAGEIDR